MELKKSSIRIKPLDFNAYEFQTVQDWLSSEECREQEKAGNLEGVENVTLHGLEHKAAMQADMPPPPMPMPKGHAALPPPPQPQQQAQQQVI